MKSLKELREEIETNRVGNISEIMDQSSLEYVYTFSKQVSGALQSSMYDTFVKIDRELGKFGYTLGDIGEQDQVFEDEDGEDLIIYRAFDGEPVKNVFLSILWKRVAPQIYRYSDKALEYSVKLTVNQIDPAEFDDLMAGEEFDYNIVDDEGFDVEESVKTKHVGRELQISTKNGNMNVKYNPNTPSILIQIDSETGIFELTGPDVETFVDLLVEHLVT